MKVCVEEIQVKQNKIISSYGDNPFGPPSYTYKLQGIDESFDFSLE